MDRARAARLAGMDWQTLRDFGFIATTPKASPGCAIDQSLGAGQMARLKAIVLAGPDPAADKIGRWRVVDLCRYVAKRWDVRYSETGMLRLLWSLDLSHRKTRPRRPQSEARAQQAFKKILCGWTVA